jgi:hypothetical protein
MHYHAEVHITSTEDVDAQVAAIMAPFDENQHPKKGIWDWYQIGGRWTGAHDGYDPESDPENSGKWPTEWKRYSGDIIPVQSIKDTLSCAALFVRGKVYQDEVWDGQYWVATDFQKQTVAEKLASLNISDGWLVTVDFHD